VTPLYMRTVADLDRAIVRGLGRVPRDVDVIVGIPRSGVLVATLIALHLQGPSLATLGELELAEGDKFEHLLLVDDTLRTGVTLDKARAAAHACAEHVTTLIAFGSRLERADVTLERVPEPRLFEWNLWRSFHLPEVAVDMDGVLCAGPAPGERDGEPYERFLKKARPLYRPRKTVRAVVTCRLERYRKQTVAWLAGHGVTYDRLYMMDYPTHAARRAARMHTRWKAEVYKTVHAGLFVESSARQAREIAQRVGAPVWCVEDQHVYGGVA
jgi:uncharacterized HAD superfamily protein